MDSAGSASQRIGVLGGTFNPVHIGHLRVALELAEMIGTDRFLLMPSASPPHKPGEPLLPFELRCELLEAAVRDLAPLEVCRIEGERSGPSFTWDTLSELRERNPGAELFFALGNEIFPQLSMWRNGLKMPSQAHLCVVPRGNEGLEQFINTARLHWPASSACMPLPGSLYTLSINGDVDGQVGFFDVPFLPVSSTRVRARWMAGQDVRLLMPRPALDALAAKAETVRAAWAISDEE